MIPLSMEAPYLSDSWVARTQPMFFVSMYLGLNLGLEIVLLKIFVRNIDKLSWICMQLDSRQKQCVQSGLMGSNNATDNDDREAEVATSASALSWI